MKEGKERYKELTELARTEGHLPKEELVSKLREIGEFASAHGQDDTALAMREAERMIYSLGVDLFSVLMTIGPVSVKHETFMRYFENEGNIRIRREGYDKDLGGYVLQVTDRNDQPL